MPSGGRNDPPLVAEFIVCQMIHPWWQCLLYAIRWYRWPTHENEIFLLPSTWSGSKSNLVLTVTFTNQNVIIQQPLITAICVNRFHHQSSACRLTKNTATILCKMSSSLQDFEVHLIGLNLHINKGSSINSGDYLPTVRVGDIWYQYDCSKISRIETTISVSPILFIC